MSSLESVLRRALAKGDQNNPIFRRRVYEAAANALENSLGSNAKSNTEALHAQNMHLAEVIKKIEAEIKLGSIRLPSQAPQSQSEPPVERPTDRTEPTQQREPAREPLTAAEPHINITAEPRQTVSPPEPPRKLRDREPIRKRPFANLMAGTVAVALLAIGLIWVLNTGAFQSAEDRDTSVANPPQVLETESFEGRDPQTARAPETIAASNTASGQWVTLFTPKDPTTLALVDGAVAEISSDLLGEFARIVTPNDVAQVQIDVPLSVFSNNKGQTMQVSITARSDEGVPTQMSVTCDFGSAKVCERHRFNVGQAENEYLLQIQMPEQVSSSTFGRIIIATDVSGSGRAIKLLNARVRPAQ